MVARDRLVFESGRDRKVLDRLPLILDIGLVVGDVRVERQLEGRADEINRLLLRRSAASGADRRRQIAVVHARRVVDVLLITAVVDMLDPGAKAQLAAGEAGVDILADIEQIAIGAIVVELHVTRYVRRADAAKLDRGFAGREAARATRRGVGDRHRGDRAGRRLVRLVRAVVLQRWIPVRVGVGLVVEMESEHVALEVDVLEIRALLGVVVADELLRRRIAVHLTIGLAIFLPLRPGDRVDVVVVFKADGREECRRHVAHFLLDLEKEIVRVDMTELKPAVGLLIGILNHGARVAANKSGLRRHGARVGAELSERAFHRTAKVIRQLPRIERQGAAERGVARLRCAARTAVDDHLA